MSLDSPRRFAGQRFALYRGYLERVDTRELHGVYCAAAANPQRQTTTLRDALPPRHGARETEAA